LIQLGKSGSGITVDHHKQACQSGPAAGGPIDCILQTAVIFIGFNTLKSKINDQNVTASEILCLKSIKTLKNLVQSNNHHMSQLKTEENIKYS